jgi:hypothetical protein
LDFFHNAQSHSQAAMAAAAAAAAIPSSKLTEMQRAASQKTDTDTLRLLAEYPGLLMAPLDASGRMALMFSAHTGRCKPLRALLQRGAPVDAQTLSGATAVSHAGVDR